MKLRFMMILSVLFIFPGLAMARKNAGDQGYGLMLGNPSGLSGKIWFSDQIAIDGALGINQSDVGIHLSFLFHDYNLLTNAGINKNPDLETPVYIGVGPRFIFSDNDEFGIRFPVGVSILPHSTPWEFFAEVAPIIRTTPDTGFDGDFAIGARYYFDAIRPRN